MKKIIILSAITALTLSADPLATYVGAKAKGMGGAFTAISNNNSAMYFNPAGLTNFEGLYNMSGTIEFGNGAKINQNSSNIDDRYDSDTSGFFGVSVSSPEGGFGFAMYSLYDLELQVLNDPTKYIKEEVEVMSLSGAYSLTKQMYPYGGALSVGITGAYASSFAGTENVDPDVINVNGYFGMIGLKARLLNHRAFKVDLGLNYRSAADLISDEESYKQYVGIGIPQEIAYGLAGSYGSEVGLFTLSTDYKQTAYADATKDTSFDLVLGDLKTLSVGADFSTPLFQVRAGAYKSDFDDTEDNSISGYTAGVGMVYKLAQIEVSYDNRTYKEALQETSEQFITVSLNIAITKVVK